MYTKCKIVVFCLIINLNVLYAQSNYSHKASEHEVFKIIKKEIQRLVSQNRLSKSWLINTEVELLKKKIIRKKTHYLTSITNNKIKNNKNNKIFIEVDVFGEVRGIYYSSTGLL